MPSTVPDPVRISTPPTVEYSPSRRAAPADIAAAFGVPPPVQVGHNPEPAPDDFEQLAHAWRYFGRAMADALRMPEFVARLDRALDRADEARQRLRGMVERNATRRHLTVRRADLRAVLDELDAHRARLAAGGEQ